MCMGVELELRGFPRSESVDLQVVLGWWSELLNCQLNVSKLSKARDTEAGLVKRLNKMVTVGEVCFVSKSRAYELSEWFPVTEVESDLDGLEVLRLAKRKESSDAALQAKIGNLFKAKRLCLKTHSSIWFHWDEKRRAELKRRLENRK